MTPLSRALSFAIENPHSDFYRRKYGKDFRAYIQKELSEIPFLTRQEIDTTPVFDRIFVPKEMVRFVRATSGSSGRGAVLFPAVEEPEMMDFRRSLGFSGDEGEAGRYFGPYFKKEDAYSLLMFSTSDALHQAYFSDYAGRRVIAGDYQHAEKTVALSAAAGVDSIFSFPSPLISIADTFKKDGFASRIKMIVLMGERMTELQRRTLVAQFPHAKIVTLYASTDAHGTMGNTCPARVTEFPNHIHPFPTYALEVIDPESGMALPMQAGTEGEVVITALTPMAFPLIRYRTGDYAVVHASGPCACGSTEPLLEILGRVELDRIKLLPYGGVSVAAIEEAIAALPFPVLDFTAAWSQKGPLPGLSLVLYTDGSVPHDSVALVAEKIQVSATHTYHDVVVRGAVLPLTVSFEPAAGARGPHHAKPKRLQIIR